MENRRNLCAMVPLTIFNRVGQERDKAGLTNSTYITQVLEEYFSIKDNGGKQVMTQNNGKTRTLAFQISEEFFQRIKTYLEKESKRLGRKVTQRDFVLGLIEQALEEAEQEAARSEETAAGQPGQSDARSETDANFPDGDESEEADGDAGTEGEEPDAVDAGEAVESVGEADGSQSTTRAEANV